MKILGLIAVAVAMFGTGYVSGARHKSADLDAFFGVSRATPTPAEQRQAVAATPTPDPLAWMHDPRRKTPLDAPAHSRTGGAVFGGWGSYVP